MGKTLSSDNTHRNKENYISSNIAFSEIKRTGGVKGDFVIRGKITERTIE